MFKKILHYNAHGDELSHLSGVPIPSISQSAKDNPKDDHTIGEAITTADKLKTTDEAELARHSLPNPGIQRVIIKNTAQQLAKFGVTNVPDGFLNSLDDEFIHYEIIESDHTNDQTNY